MKEFPFEYWLLLNVNPKDTLNKFGSQKYQDNITKKHRLLSPKYHPDKNKDVDATEKSANINNAKDYLLSSQSRSDLINWYLDNQTNMHASDSSTEQPKFTSSSAFSWFSIRGFIRALDWLICNLFYIVSGIAFFMAQDITALTMLWFSMLNFYQFLLYTAVGAIASGIMTVLIGLDNPDNLRNWQKYLRCISCKIPSITITAAMILYVLIQPVSIKVFLLSMSPLSLFSISILFILMMVDFGMKDYPSLIFFKENISIVHATVLLAMAFVSNSLLFCVSMNVLFFYTYIGCKVVSESRFLAYAFTWCFPPDLEFEKSHSELDLSDINNPGHRGNQQPKAITWLQSEEATDSMEMLHMRQQ
jgi:hypothetical protein